MQEDWRDYAACAGMDPEMWFAMYLARGRLAPKTLRALEICRSCPVKADCLADALALASAMNYAVPGVWGGTIEAERMKMIKARPAVQPVSYDGPTRQCHKCRVHKPLHSFTDGRVRCDPCGEVVRKWEQARRAQRSA